MAKVTKVPTIQELIDTADYAQQVAFVFEYTMSNGKNRRSKITIFEDMTPSEFVNYAQGLIKSTKKYGKKNARFYALMHYTRFYVTADGAHTEGEYKEIVTKRTRGW